MTKPIVLASSSPRRKALLEGIGLTFEVQDSFIQERPEVFRDPKEYVERLSFQKAEAVARVRRDAVVIAADTIGMLDGQIIGKPKSMEDARHMLGMLSGKHHTVLTGFTIMEADTGITVTESVATEVFFRDLEKHEIDLYVQSLEPMDKAGSYAIQGLGAILVARIEGDYYNVVGLPLSAVAVALKTFDIDVLGIAFA